MATLERCVIAYNGIAGPTWYQAGDSLIKPSYVVSRDDADEVKIAPADEPAPLGVAGCPTWHDLNTVFTAGDSVPVWEKGSGVEIFVLHDDDTGATTLIRGQLYQVDDANAGCVMLWAYTDAAVATDSISGVIGMLTKDVTISGDTPTFIPLRI
ncbi:MAG: hypothetical protein GY853_16720 [PVC group bacterium]|nr:hypothetical protein [PVC group bacterium]